jgi:putative phosphoesterase
MTICVISDSHGYIGKDALKHINDSDIVLHAGDVGPIECLDAIQPRKKLIAVYGNIDDHKVRAEYPEYHMTTINSYKILMIHIAGKPGYYNTRTKEIIKTLKPNMLICGHSHILKIQYYKNKKLLHINPGAIGIYGMHKQRTLLKFKVEKGQAKEMFVVDLGERKLPDSIDRLD